MNNQDIKQSLTYEEYLAKLIKIKILEGKYATARHLLNNSKQDNISLKFLFGLLENIENNFKTSKKYYHDCLVDPNFQHKSLLAIAKIHIQNGDNEIARQMLQTLQLNTNFYVQATYNLIALNILEGDYEKAFYLLKTIDITQLTKKLLHHYRILNLYLLYMLGKLNEIPDYTKQDYMFTRLLDKSDAPLLKHLSKHFDQTQKDNNGCFLESLDLKKLLQDAREKIATINGNHFEITDMYRFRLDEPIGFKHNELTNDLCVVTMIGTQDIVTMYPVLLSSEFDREGFSQDKAIALKRKQGGMKKC